ncbi:hypothetical protein AB0D11_37085 [Streptomyces monashensis]|uniref:hypothetical protein n=1 Tax=Streptomyces monashensis TaxID=1678012 RepID=UPI00340F3C02
MRTGSSWHGCGPWAHGFAALSWFLSTDGDTVLTCAQGAGDAAYDPNLRGSGLTAALAGQSRYRRYLGLAVADETYTTGCLVTAALDVMESSGSAPSRTP